MTTPIDCTLNSDEELVTLALQNSDWFFCLAKRYEEKLARYIARISGGHKEDVEDTLQDVFVKTYQNLNSFDTRLKFSSWIYRIAHNESISAMRKRSVRPVVHLEDEDMQKFAGTLDIEKDINNIFDREIINSILALMDQKYAEVLTLRYLEEKDYIEIADILQKPISTVGNLISRGKKLFKVEYENITNEKHG
ncbi:MAG TPA: RNA polymerase sigma factor [Candidatus Paceibacterota bacterium]|nr:RNA polymerase sigma factor [Candidatus Paceibacterota bacterium]